jgi:hypothetical protein
MAMWSVAVFEPALLGRRSMESGSPVPSGPGSTNPSPRLSAQQRNVGQAVPTGGQRQPEIQDDLGRVVDRHRLAPRGQRGRRPCPDRWCGPSRSAAPHRPDQPRPNRSCRHGRGDRTRQPASPGRCSSNCSVTSPSKTYLPKSGALFIDRHGLTRARHKSVRLVVVTYPHHDSRALDASAVSPRVARSTWRRGDSNP